MTIDRELPRLFTLRRRLALSAILALGLAAAACGGAEGECNGSPTGGGFLEGSYCSEADLSWSEVRIERQPVGQEVFFSVEYIRPAGDSTETTLAISFIISRVIPNPNEDIEFLKAGGSVRRVTASGNPDLTNQLDPDASTLTFTEEYQDIVGTPVEGRFSLRFVDSGRSLLGEFSGTLTDPLDNL